MDGSLKIRLSNDKDEAARLWKRLWPEDDVFSSWQVRRAFDESYDRPMHLLIAEKGGRECGFLSLSHIEEEDYFGAFPGETWNGDTWIEQNMIPSSSDEVARALWERAPGNTVLRYVTSSCSAAIGTGEVDETGYVFYPSEYGYSYEKYLMAFSGKSRKRLGREIDSIGDIEISENGGSPGDIEWMLRVNMEGFGKESYFSDPRFCDGFERMISALSSSGRLRVTTAKVGGKRAAVDIGAVLGSRYTILAGAASTEFPGIAKAINFHHMRVSCREKFSQTDFLCGDFGWKERFHLTARPLYVINRHAAGRQACAADGRMDVCA